MNKFSPSGATVLAVTTVMLVDVASRYHFLRLLLLSAPLFLV